MIRDVELGIAKASTCRHRRRLARSVRCLDCRREEKHVMELVRNRLRNVVISADPYERAKQCNDALADMALPYGLRVEAVVNENGLALRLLTPTL